MKKLLIITLLSFAIALSLLGQSNFNYSIQLTPVTVTNLPGLHSYAFAQSNGKWLMIGGRLDGLHARQPFNSFPAASNNTDIYVVDVANQQFWSASLSSLPTGLQEQLQATNMNFFQMEDTLYIAGGYAFSATANDHITFPNLTTVQVSGLMDAIINNTAIDSYFKQLTDSVFAVTGGQLGAMGDTLWLIGGHRFDGRYNPMGHNTFVQTYTNQIRKFTVDNSGVLLSYDNYTAITDPVHLHRRDYNLVPQIFPDGTEGYTISSGVFQTNADLPYLYPVDITSAGHTPKTGFNQYLSNYHCASAALYDSVNNEMHALLFGGMSQYYYDNGTLIQDNNVPFVKTISRLTRTANGTLTEYQQPEEMPSLQGASAEFIPNHALPHTNSDIIKLSKISADSILIGHIYGGIYSPSLNPFTNNATNTTSADNTIYAVYLVKDTSASTGVQPIPGTHVYDFNIYPNPASDKVNISFNAHDAIIINYTLTTCSGQVLDKGLFRNNGDTNTYQLDLAKGIASQVLYLTLEFDHKYFVTKKIALQ